MIREITAILNGLKKSTGIDVELFSESGIPLGTTKEEPAPYPLGIDKARLKDGVASDGGKTLFLCEKGSFSFICAVDGTGEKERNYAVLLKKIVDAELIRLGAATGFNDRLRLLLSGEASEAQISALKSGVERANFYMLCLVTSKDKISELMNFLQAASGTGDIAVRMDERTAAYLKVCDSDDEYQSASEFAYILYENVKEELRIELKVGVGGVVRSFEELCPSYGHAVMSCNLGTLIDPESNIYSYKEYVLVRMLTELPKSTVEHNLSYLTDKGFMEILSDAELMTTAEVFLKNSLNISETSRSMYMHRNTLIYRLDKIEKATGLNLRHFNDAMTFRLITVLDKLVKGKDKRK